MFNALKLLRHAIALLTRSPMKTIAVVSPGLILMICVVVSAAIFAPEMLTYGSRPPAMEGWRLQGLPILLGLCLIVSYSLMAVLWHRYTLSASNGPEPIGVKLLLGYLWRVTLLALIQLAASLILILPLTIAQYNGDGLMGGPALPSVLLTTFVTQLVMLWLSLRLSLILPAAALGRPISMMQSWHHTSPMTRAIWGISCLLALLNTALTALINAVAPPTAGRTLAIELPIYVLEGLLIFSVLTTLYAQLVQNKRVVVT